MDKVLSAITAIKITDVVDIVIVAFIIYKIMNLIKETRAEQLVRGMLLVMVFAKISEWFNLYTINWLLSNAMTVGVLAILVVFQPELRRALEYIGRSNILNKSLVDIRGENSERYSDEIVRAVASLSRQKIGALIVLQNKTGLGEVTDTGTVLNAKISSELLINIFIPNTPLHDGAVIIKDDTILAAGCFLPLTTNNKLAKDLGTRHRAALGISERSDALVVVVSEETGGVSLAEKGELSRHVDIETLRQVLYNQFVQEATGLLASWRRNDDGTD